MRIFNKLFPQLSIIISVHNEGANFVSETIQTIKESIDISYEIIVVDDGSDIPVVIPGVRNIWHKSNNGVGAAFDSGARAARSKNIFLMGCDVRFVKNGWASKMVAEIKKHPKSLICTSVVSLWSHDKDMTFEKSRKLWKYNGATILFDDIIAAEWIPRDYLPLCKSQPEQTECYEVPCILGAAYGVSKKWYKYLDGFWGHKKWGTLEPYISLKSWLFGGNCLTAPHIETSHIFKAKGTHGTEPEFMVYNKLLVLWLLFSIPDKDRMMSNMERSDSVSKAVEMIEENMQDILSNRNEYRKRTVFSINDFVKKFNLKWIS